MMQQGPTGVFDSGEGRLIVLNELKAQLPQYNFLFVGNMPAHLINAIVRFGS